MPPNGCQLQVTLRLASKVDPFLTSSRHSPLPHAQCPQGSTSIPGLAQPHQDSFSSFQIR